MNFIKGGRKEGNGINIFQYLLYIRHCARWFICHCTDKETEVKKAKLILSRSKESGSNLGLQCSKGIIEFFENRWVHIMQ